MSMIPVVQETFLRLRRDRIFLPAFLVGSGLLGLSGLASYWGVEEFYKILFDLGTTSFHLTGALVAIFWGTKIISDSKQEGSIEVQLASPLPRHKWLLGKYLGLALTLILLAILFLFGWQLIYLGYGIGFIGWGSIIIFSILSLSWLSMAAAAIFFASLSSYAVALFSSAWLFICGLLSAPIMQSLSPETPEDIKSAINAFAGIWNLHYFNLYEFGAKVESIPADSIIQRTLYGSVLIAFFLSGSILAFSRKDLVGD